MRRLKVFTIQDIIRGEQIEVAVATATKHEAARILRVSDYYLRTWGSETGNEHDIEVATKRPREVVFLESLNLNYSRIRQPVEELQAELDRRYNNRGEGQQ
jgi:hypothetical protein